MRKEHLISGALLGGLLAILPTFFVFGAETLHATCVPPTTADKVFAWITTPVLMSLRSFTQQTSTHLLIQIMYGALVGLAAGAFIEHRSKLRIRKTCECRVCAYNLTGNISGRCPECGEAVEASA